VLLFPSERFSHPVLLASSLSLSLSLSLSVVTKETDCLVKRKRDPNFLVVDPRFSRLLKKEYQDDDEVGSRGEGTPLEEKREIVFFSSSSFFEDKNLKMYR
jgi:hypothetical protein